MTNVVKLGSTARSGEPNDDVIERLEELLALAKTGEIQAISYAIVKAGCTALDNGWVGARDSTAWLLAATQLLSRDILDLSVIER